MCVTTPQVGPLKNTDTKQDNVLEVYLQKYGEMHKQLKAVQQGSRQTQVTSSPPPKGPEIQSCTLTTALKAERTRKQIKRTQKAKIITQGK